MCAQINLLVSLCSLCNRWK